MTKIKDFWTELKCIVTWWEIKLIIAMLGVILAIITVLGKG